MIKVGKVQYNKGIAVIYNPCSGNSNNIRNQISESLIRAGVKYTFYETRHYLHGMQLT
jgi:hypothetical protein